MVKEVLFTTSWDDGHPLDLRVADLLRKHGFSGTFYIPCRNPGSHCTPDGLPVVSAGELRILASSFEIGAHTLDHQFLDEVIPAEAKRQITEGKDELEARLGSTVAGFCYPGGRFSAQHIQFLHEAGFRFARGIVNLEKTVPTDHYRMPTTLQFYPHSRRALTANYVRQGRWHQRAALFVVAFAHKDLRSRLEAALDHVCRDGGVFHLWGHAWEIERFGGWETLDAFLRYADERIPKKNRISNGALLDRSNDPTCDERSACVTPGLS